METQQQAYSLLKNEAPALLFCFIFDSILQMTKLRKEFSVACNGNVPSTYRFPGAELVLFTCSHQPMLIKIRKFSSKIDSGLFTKMTSSHQNNGFPTKICGGVFEQPARYTTRYQESDLHLAFILLNLFTTSTYSTSPTLPLLLLTY